MGENVLGLVNWSGGLVFHEVQADLEAEGYEVFPYVLPACAVNAPHRRDRVWFVAYSNKKQLDAVVTKDGHIKKRRSNAKKIGGNDWSEFELGAEIRDSRIGFYDGDNFEPAITRKDDGLSEELDELEAFGNAIVPQVALQIFNAINEFEASK